MRLLEYMLAGTLFVVFGLCILAGMELFVLFLEGL